MLPRHGRMLSVKFNVSVDITGYGLVGLDYDVSGDLFDGNIINDVHRVHQDQR